jgi:hypothetical protein
VEAKQKAKRSGEKDEIPRVLKNVFLYVIFAIFLILVV